MLAKCGNKDCMISCYYVASLNAFPKDKIECASELVYFSLVKITYADTQLNRWTLTVNWYLQQQ